EDAALLAQPVVVERFTPVRRFTPRRGRHCPTSAAIEPGVAWSFGHLAHLLADLPAPSSPRAGPAQDQLLHARAVGRGVSSRLGRGVEARSLTRRRRRLILLRL